MGLKYNAQEGLTYTVWVKKVAPPPKKNVLQYFHFG